MVSKYRYTAGRSNFPGKASTFSCDGVGRIELILSGNYAEKLRNSVCATRLPGGCNLMTESAKSEDLCKAEVKISREHRAEIPDIVEQLVLSCRREDCFNHVGLGALPSREAAIDLIHRGCRLLYPGYYIRQRLDEINLGYYFGQEAVAFFEALAGQLTLCIRHECLRYDLDCTHCEERGQEEAIRFMRELPALRTRLARDVRAAYRGGPGCQKL